MFEIHYSLKKLEEKEGWKENKRSVSFNSKLFQKRHNAKIFNNDRAGSLWTVPSSRTPRMASLHCHAIKNKNRNHSVNKAKNLGCDR